MRSGNAFIRARAACTLAVFTLLFVLPASPFAFAARKPIEIRSIRIVPFDGSKTVFVVSASERPKFDIFALQNPERLVIDCGQAVLAYPISGALTEANPAIIRIRTAQFDKDLVRIVIDLKQRVEYRASIDGNNLIIQVGQDTTFRSSSPQTDYEMSVGSAQPSRPVTQQDKKSPESKSRWKMKGYSTDRLQRSAGGEQNNASMANAYALFFRFRDDYDNSSLRINYSVTGYEFAESGIENSMSQDFKIGYQWRLGSNWRVKTVGKAGLKQAARQYRFIPELEYRFNRNNSFHLYGGHRTQVFPWQDRIDQNRFVGVTYETRIGRQALELGYRYNVNDSEMPWYDYVNSKYTLGYKIPWSKKSRTLFQLEYSPREYTASYITGLEDDLEYRALREEEGWTFSAVSRIPLSRTFELVPRYAFKIKYFNDPWKDDYTRHSSSFALRGRW